MFYQQLNLFIEKLEQNLDDEINYVSLAKGVGLHFATLQKVFPLLAGVSVADYVRQRRLTLAGRDLVQSNLRVIDVAMRYGYASTEAFSRAFSKFHHVMPSEVKQHVDKLVYYPKLEFKPPTETQSLTYSIIESTTLNLCGFEIITNHHDVKIDAPALYDRIAEQYPNLPHPEFGVLDYKLGRDNDEAYHYYALWQAEQIQEYPDFVRYQIPALRWLQFTVPSQLASDIQAASNQFYENFLPTCEYQLRPEPDLECYHDGVTDFRIPIY